MCDYCDCRSHPEIAALSHDHEAVLALTAALRRASAGAGERSIDALLDELAAVLAPHTRREEVGVFGALRDVDVPDDYVGVFEHDHAEIDATMAVTRQDHAHLSRLVTLVERHVHAEETDMYPAAHQLLAPADWDDLDRRVAATESLAKR
jgi:hypothetical protein